MKRFELVKPNTEPRRVHVCTICGRKGEWKAGWEWRFELHKPFQPDAWEETVKTCSEACRKKDRPREERQRRQLEKALARLDRPARPRPAAPTILPEGSPAAPEEGEATAPRAAGAAP